MLAVTVFSENMVLRFFFPDNRQIELVGDCITNCKIPIVISGSRIQSIPHINRHQSSYMALKKKKNRVCFFTYE